MSNRNTPTPLFSNYDSINSISDFGTSENLTIDAELTDEDYNKLKEVTQNSKKSNETINLLKGLSDFSFGCSRWLINYSSKRCYQKNGEISDCNYKIQPSWKVIMTGLKGQDCIIPSPYP